MLYTIAKDFTFEAAHQLSGLPPDHKCSRLHGHNYRVRLYLRASLLGQVGFVEDFGDLAPFGAWLRANWDHRYLNDVFDGNPTAECLAAYLYTVAADLWPSTIHAVRVYETPDCYAEFKEA